MIQFAGRSSTSLGVYVEKYPSRPVPARKSEVFSVPGRSGDVLVVEDAWENTEQPYDIYLSAEGPGLPQVADAVVQWLMQPGYARLEDDYAPDVFRLAAFLGPLDLKNTLNDFGRATIKFNCQPQRYLKSGEMALTTAAKTVDGAVVTIQDGGDKQAVTDLSAAIAPVQSGSGAPSPENVRPISGWTKLTLSQTGADPADAQETEIDWTSTAGTVYGGTLDLTTGVLTVDHAGIVFDGSSDESWNYISGNSRFYIAVSDIDTGTADTVTADILCSCFTAAPYGGSAPPVPRISGRYGIGQLNVFYTGVSSLAAFRDWLQANPMQVVYKLATPVTYQLIAVEIKTLLGMNVFSADTGDVTLQYTPGGIDNPTAYAARPLITVRGSGSGSFTIGGQTVTISAVTDGMVLDCAEQEAYSESGGVVSNLNSVVSGAFPLLQPGASALGWTGGVTGLEIVPRWFEL